jgi:hypothetical protein
MRKGGTPDRQQNRDGEHGQQQASQRDLKRPRRLCFRRLGFGIDGQSSVHILPWQARRLPFV